MVAYPAFPDLVSIGYPFPVKPPGSDISDAVWIVPSAYLDRVAVGFVDEADLVQVFSGPCHSSFLLYSVDGVAGDMG